VAIRNVAQKVIADFITENWLTVTTGEYTMIS
jgi:hypothetical protein